MSKRKYSKALSSEELGKLADAEFSDEDDWEPFEASESDYICSSSESDSDSTSDSECDENIRKTIIRKKKIKSDAIPNQSNVKSNLDPVPNFGSEQNQNPEAHLGPAPNFDPELNADPEMDANPRQDIDMLSSSNWGPIAGNYKKIPEFSANAGVIPEVAALLAEGKPGDFFDAIVDDNVISMICNQTNLFATQILLNTDATPSSRLREWVPTTNSEIRNFLGLIAWMGLIKLPKSPTTGVMMNFSLIPLQERSCLGIDLKFC